MLAQTIIGHMSSIYWLQRSFSGGYCYKYTTIMSSIVSSLLFVAALPTALSNKTLGTLAGRTKADCPRRQDRGLGMQSSLEKSVKVVADDLLDSEATNINPKDLEKSRKTRRLSQCLTKTQRRLRKRHRRVEIVTQRTWKNKDLPRSNSSCVNILSTVRRVCHYA